MEVSNKKNIDCLLRHNEKMQKALREIESGFVSEMIRPMFQSAGDGTENKIYRSMMVDEYSKFIGPKIGIAEKLSCSLLKFASD
ncbi:MAG: hypothetical protein HRK26_02225 [Rickettsiaceae bacterium H1]|nr:hypothetical protein [Rickettsiaceae bacterium H1]